MSGTERNRFLRERRKGIAGEEMRGEREKRAIKLAVRAENRRTVDRVGRPKNPESSVTQSGRPGRSTQKTREY